MKRHIYYLILTIMLAALSASSLVLAQTTPNSKSRLDIKPKSKTTATGSSQKAAVPFLRNPETGKFPSEIRVNRSTTINEFYRQLINSQPSKVQPTADIAIKTTNESKTNSDEAFQNVEKLYSNDKITISNIYPNPASEIANIDYSLSPSVGEAKLVFINVLGSTVGEYVLEKNERKLSIRTSEYSNGFYFYQLYVDGKSLVTKKLLIRRQ